jgi:hypothetical protein
MEYLEPKEIQQVMEEVIDRYLIPSFLALGMNASGEWREHLEGTPDGRIRGRDYTIQLVNGRRPGTYAPIEPLKQWAMIKLGLDEKQATGMAFAMSKKFKEEGSKYYREGGTTLLDILESQDVIQYITSRFQFFITQQITLEIQQYLKLQLR